MTRRLAWCGFFAFELAAFHAATPLPLVVALVTAAVACGIYATRPVQEKP